MGASGHCAEHTVPIVIDSLYNSAVLSLLAMLCVHHHQLLPKVLYLCSWKFCMHYKSTLFLLLRPRQPGTCCLWVCMCIGYDLRGWLSLFSPICVRLSRFIHSGACVSPSPLVMIKGSPPGCLGSLYSMLPCCRAHGCVSMQGHSGNPDEVFIGVGPVETVQQQVLEEVPRESP